jgi:hypothetical protein
MLTSSGLTRRFSYDNIIWCASSRPVRLKLTLGVGVLVRAALLPVMRYLWLSVSSGNANYVFTGRCATSDPENGGTPQWFTAC